MSSRLSEETGRVLGGRYRLVAPVGIGTSSRVFLAVDTQLRRRVAVKLLHEALADDEGFLRRFRAEARAAGALSHPNIVAVFDWGEDSVDGATVPYLVTEYLGGGSLRDVLDRGHALSPGQAVLLGLDATRALGHAHQRGLVHRDVKPANLLFDEQGRLRLADFGLARALAEASWTEPSGMGVGSAWYASPEQALGRRLDGRSDVYSLALVLVECATGQVPFVADSTAGTLALRTQGDLQLGAELGGIRNVLERAGRLDPDDRPDAAVFEISLMAAAEELDRPEPIPIVPTLGDGESTTELNLVDELSGLAALGALGEREPVVLAEPPPVVISDEQDEQDEASSGADDAPVSAIDERTVSERAAAGPIIETRIVEEGVDEGDDGTVGEGAAQASASSRSPITVAEEHDLLTASRPMSFGRVEPLVGSTLSADRSGGPRRWPRRVLAVVAVMALLGGAAAAWWFVIRVPVHEVADFTGVSVAEATATAEELGWVVDDSAVDRRDGTTAGEVLEQEPVGGTTLAEGEAISFTVSLGPTLVAIPDVAGRPEAEARDDLVTAGLQVGAVTRAFDEDAPVDAVVTASPAAGSAALDPQGQLPKTSVIDLVVSDGPAPRAVPAGLQGARADEAVAALAAVGLEASRPTSFSETVPQGFVISVDPPAGTELERGDTVRLEVSKGPAPVPIPDLRFNTGAFASTLLEEQGFVVAGIEGPPSGLVLATDPPAGELHSRGTPVRIFTRG